MGIFRKNDELFEIMSRHTRPARYGGGAAGGTPSGAATRTPPPSTRPSASASSSAASTWRQPRLNPLAPASSSSSKPGEEELFELDGEALVLVDDGFVEGLGDEPPEPEVKTLVVRQDTVVVGAILTTALLVAAFLFGRTSAEPAGADPQGPGEVAVVIREQAPAQAAAAQPEGQPQAPLASQAQQPHAQTAAAPQGQSGPIVPQTVPGGFRPEGGAATSAAASAPGQAVALPASAPQVEEKYMLVVCTTSSSNAVELARWLNEQPRSPIFGREGVKAEAKGGEVRIRGFAQRDDTVLDLVKQTPDPLGGGRPFESAYFRNVR